MRQKAAKVTTPGRIAPEASVRRKRAGWLGAGAAAMAAAALTNMANARRAEAKTPPAGDFIQVDGVRLHYVDRGEGPVVVLLHGNSVMLQDFEVSGVLGLASQRHRVLAFDRPGFGYSSRPRSTVWTPAAQAALIAGALKKLGVQRAVILGHSWGAMVALAIALDHPELVGGLVLISGYYYPTARPDVLFGSLTALPILGDLIALTISPLVGLLSGPAALKASFAPAPVPGRMADYPFGLVLRPSQIRATAAEAALMVPAATNLATRYRALALPVTIIAGEGDLVTHVDKHAERLAQDIAAAELRVVPGQGHLVHFGVPGTVTDAISRISARSARG